MQSFQFIIVIKFNLLLMFSYFLDIYMLYTSFSHDSPINHQSCKTLSSSQFGLEMPFFLPMNLFPFPSDVTYFFGVSYQQPTLLNVLKAD